MSAQPYPGNTGNSFSHEFSSASRDAYENARASSSYVAPFANSLDKPKAQWIFDSCNGVALCAPL